MAEVHSEIDDSETSEDSDESDSPGERDSETLETKNDHEAGSSQEEDNFLRYFLLAHLAVDAVRIWFDSIVPPRKLEKHLKRHRKKAFKNCSAEQKDVLFPENPVTSEKFDITLFYKIIRNTTDVKKPRKGWGEEPDSADIEPADDLERVRICRNFLSHCPPSVSDVDFGKKWKELSEVIKRLGKGQLDGKIDSLKDKLLDYSTRRSLRLDLAALRERVEDVEKSVAHHIPRNLKEQYQKLLQKWQEDDRIFTETHSYQAILEKMKTIDHVTVTGGGGTGKTSLVRHVALQLANEGYEILPVSSIDEIIICGNISVKQVFVVDDVLGVHGLDVGLYNSWIAKSERIFNLLETGSKLLMTCRSVVLKESKQLTSFITHFDHVIDLGDAEHQLTDEDKKVILEIHCKHKQLKKELFENLCLSNSLPIFPLLCWMFSSNEKYRDMGEQFFHLPYHCLFSELDKMRTVRKMHYAAIVYCAMKNNCVSSDDLDTTILEDVYNCCRVNKSTSDWELRDALEALVGSYLDQDTYDKFSFIHDKLFEIVVVHFGKQFPDCIIKHAPSNFIYKFIAFDEHGPINNADCITLSDFHFPVLVERVLCDLGRFHLYDVFNCDVLKSAIFVSTFCKTCSDFPLHEIKTLFFDYHNCEHLFEQTNRKADEMNRMFDLGTEAMFTEDRKIKLPQLDFRLEILNRPVFKVLYWMIGYGHAHLLSSVIELVHSKSLGENRNTPDSKANVTKPSETMFSMDPESQGICLTLACASGNVEMVTLVLENVNPECINYGVDSGECCSSLVVAASHGWNDIVEVLLREGASDIQNNAIVLACAFGHDNVVENLITHGCDVNLYPDDLKPLLVVASLTNNIEIVKNLIKHGAIVDLCDCDGISPLHCASGLGHLEVVKYLIECGADVNLCDNNGVSPLSSAAKQGRLEVVTCLMENNANVNVGISCLSAACSGGHLDVVKYLIDKINVNQVDVLCDPVLHAASSCGHLDIVKYLTEQGADINLLSSSNDSSLYCAAEKGELAVVEYLVQHGADLRKGLEIAIQCGNQQIVEYLLNYFY